MGSPTLRDFMPCAWRAKALFALLMMATAFVWADSADRGFRFEAVASSEFVASALAMVSSEVAANAVDAESTQSEEISGHAQRFATLDGPDLSEPTDAVEKTKSIQAAESPKAAGNTEVFNAPGNSDVAEVEPVAAGSIADAEQNNDIIIAVAANFLDAATRFAKAYEQQTGYSVTIVSGATGKLYAQIRHGAPFDVFLAADVARPQRLIDEGLAVPESAFIYALGVLSLWYPANHHVDAQSLWQHPVAFLAMANPALAPYGTAAKQAVAVLGGGSPLASQTVLSDNITGAFSLVATGNAQAGFVAYSHLIAAEIDARQYWVLPAELYAPIAQMAVLLKRAEHRVAAQRFMAYLQSPKVQAQLSSLGYAAVQKYD